MLIFFVLGVYEGSLGDMFYDNEGPLINAHPAGNDRRLFQYEQLGLAKIRGHATA